MSCAAVDRDYVCAALRGALDNLKSAEPGGSAYLHFREHNRAEDLPESVPRASGESPAVDMRLLKNLVAGNRSFSQGEEDGAIQNLVTGLLEWVMERDSKLSQVLGMIRVIETEAHTSPKVVQTLAQLTARLDSAVKTAEAFFAVFHLIRRTFEKSRRPAPLLEGFVMRLENKGPPPEDVYARALAILEKAS